MQTQAAPGLTPAQEDMRRRLDAQERAELIALRERVKSFETAIGRVAMYAREALGYHKLPADLMGDAYHNAIAVKTRLQYIQGELTHYREAIKREQLPRFDANGSEVSP